MEAELDAFVSLARASVESWVRSNKRVEAPSPAPSEMNVAAGAFVCLKKHGQLRGCIGTIQAVEDNLADEVISNAISAAVRDPRFEPLTANELDQLTYTVDILRPPERIDSMDQLDPRKYGVIVESGRKRGLLLPDLEGVDTVEDQVSIASHKAGIFHGEPITLYRFEVERHGKE